MVVGLILGCYGPEQNSPVRPCLSGHNNPMKQPSIRTQIKKKKKSVLQANFEEKNLW